MKEVLLPRDQDSYFAHKCLPLNVGIFTFISRINITADNFKARQIYIF